MIADIATGHTAGSDVLLLIAAVVFALAAVVAAGIARRDRAALAPALTPAGLCLVAVALLIL